MAFDPLGDDKTDKERCITEASRGHPNWSKAKIADHCDTSKSYVTETLRRYDGPWDLAL